MKVYLLYRYEYYGGYETSETLEDIFTNPDTAERESIKLHNIYGDDYISFYVEEYDVNESQLEDEQ